MLSPLRSASTHPTPASLTSCSACEQQKAPARLIRRFLSPKFPLLLDLQIDGKQAFAIERTYRLHSALLSVVLRPNLVIRVLRELTETVIPIVIGKIALHRKAASVFQINHRAFDRLVIRIGDLSLNDSLRRPALLGKRTFASDGDGKDSHTTGGKDHLADK